MLLAVKNAKISGNIFSKLLKPAGKYGIISMLVSEFHLSEMLVYQIFPKCHLPFLGVNGTFLFPGFCLQLAG